MSIFDWNFQNIFYITFVLTLAILSISEIITIYFEIPIRILINKLIKNKNDEYENIENENIFFIK